MKVEKINKQIVGNSNLKNTAKFPIFSNDNVSFGSSASVSNLPSLKTLAKTIGSAEKIVGFKKLWEFKTEGPNFNVPCYSPDGTLYVGSDIGEFFGKVYAIEAGTGNKKWEFETEGAVSFPCLDNNGSLYFGGGDKFYVVDAKTGEKKRQAELQFGSFGAPLYLGPDSILYAMVGDHEGQKIYAIRADNGEVKWKRNFEDATRGSLCLGSDGNLYIGGGGEIYVIDTSSGKRKKTLSFDADGFAVNEPICVSPNGILYVGPSANRQVYAIDVNSGKTKWKFKTDADFGSSPSLSPDGATLFIGSGDHKIYALDANNGSKKWEFKTGGGIFTTPRVGQDGILYFGSYDGKIYALDANSGEKLADFNTGLKGNQITISFAPGGRTVFVTVGKPTLAGGGGPGRLYALRLETMEDAKKEIGKENSQDSGMKIVKDDKNVQIGSVKIPLNQRYRRF